MPVYQLGQHSLAADSLIAVARVVLIGKEETFCRGLPVARSR
jgi:hypothetical protein